MDQMISLINWVKIFASGFILTTIISLITFFSTENLYLQISAGILFVIGNVISYKITENIRKKVGTEEFMARNFSNPEFNRNVE
ncbi:MAG: hypothetical protein ACOVNU_01790 [Candidatus Kapaibacteriota bacterium]|jgi:hypothetical protein